MTINSPQMFYRDIHVKQERAHTRVARVYVYHPPATDINISVGVGVKRTNGKRLDNIDDYSAASSGFH